MEEDIFSGIGNGQHMDTKLVQTFEKKFVQVQAVLDQNRVLINEINQNHRSNMAANLSRNVGLIRELNNNTRRVVDLYAELSNSYMKSTEGESGGTSKSDARGGNKRIRSGN